MKRTIQDEQVTVLVAGDSALRDPLAVPAGDDLDVIGHVHTGTETIGQVLSELPDVVVIDARIEGPDIRAIGRRLRAWAPATKMLAAVPDDDEASYTSIVAGAIGAITLGVRPDEMADAVHRAARGESILAPRMAGRLLGDLDDWARRSADPMFPPPTLTATEREVLLRLEGGQSSAEIAESHGVTTHLVNQHARYAVTKLHMFVLGAEPVGTED